MIMTKEARIESNLIRLCSFILNTPCSSLHQRPGLIQIGCTNGPGGPVCQGASQTQGVVTHILRKDARTRDRSTDIMRSLVNSCIVMITELFHLRLYLHYCLLYTS